jgi:hypothetical protein
LKLSSEVMAAFSITPDQPEAPGAPPKSCSVQRWAGLVGEIAAPRNTPAYKGFSQPLLLAGADQRYAFRTFSAPIGRLGSDAEAGA